MKIRHRSSSRESLCIGASAHAHLPLAKSVENNDHEANDETKTHMLPESITVLSRPHSNMGLEQSGLTLSDPSSNPATAREPSGDRSHDLAHGDKGITTDFISTSPVIFHTWGQGRKEGRRK